MGKNSIAIGEKSYEGDYGRILSAGDIDITGSEVKKLYMAGDADIIRSKIKKMRIAGDITAVDCEFGNVKLAGAINLKGICKADLICILGDLNAENLECNIIKQSSVKEGRMNHDMEWNGFIKAITLEVLHTLSISFDYNIKNIISAGSLISQKEIECENLYSFEGLNAPSVNADNIFILINKGIRIDFLSGTSIKIKNCFAPDKTFSALPKYESYRKSMGNGEVITVNQIEGDNIDVEYVKCDLLSGNDVVIGDLCIVQRVEYRKSIKISPKAVVIESVKL